MLVEVLRGFPPQSSTSTTGTINRTIYVISDHVAEIDLLYYDAIATRWLRCSVDILTTAHKTIGIHGAWGAGKSSVLAMIKIVGGKTRRFCVSRFNGCNSQASRCKGGAFESIITLWEDARTEGRRFAKRRTCLNSSTTLS